MQLDRELLITLAALHLTSWFYNALVSWLEHKNYHSGYVAFLVVVGVAYTVAALYPYLGSENTLLLTLAFIASGTPMIVGSVIRHVRHRNAEDTQLREQAHQRNHE